MENVLGSIRSVWKVLIQVLEGVREIFSFGQGFLAVAPCNSDVETANISKHLLTSPRIGKRRARRFSLLA